MELSERTGLASSQRPWVFIRVDASIDAGSGHLMRCLALAEAFALRSFGAVFGLTGSTGEVRQTISSRGFGWVRLDRSGESGGLDSLIDANNCVDWLRRQPRLPSWLVLDSYSLDVSWERGVRSLRVPLLVIDDLSDRVHECDAFLDQNMIEKYHKNYPSTVSAGARLLLGGEFTLLRGEFENARGRRCQNLTEGGAEDIAIFLGGSDPDNLTVSVVSQLVEFLNPSRLVVLVGVLNRHRAEIEDFCTARKIRCYFNFEKVAKVLAQTRLFIGACGMSAIEAQAVGVPCILIPLSKIQLEVAKFLVAEKCAVILDPIDVVHLSKLKEAWRAAMTLGVLVSSSRSPAAGGARKVVDVLLQLGDE